MSDPKITLPSGGGAYERQADGSLEQVEKPTLWEASVELADAPAEEAVKAPLTRNVKEA